MKVKAIGKVRFWFYRVPMFFSFLWSRDPFSGNRVSLHDAWEIATLGRPRP
jgi:hypothetical protein